MTRTVLFMCPHHAAKSLIASALFSAEAARRGLALRVNSAGTEPDEQAQAPVVEMLAAEGHDVRGHKPRHFVPHDLDSAWRVVSMGCDVSDVAPAGTRIEHWTDVPAASEQLAACRESIHQHVLALLDEIEVELAGAVE